MSTAVIVCLLVAILGRSFANGHDIRDDWTTSERVFCALTILGPMGTLGALVGLWLVPT